MRTSQALRALLGLAALAEAKVWRYNMTISEVFSDPDGHGRAMFAINDQSPGPVLTVKEGDEMEVFVENGLLTEATMHWHGIYQWDHPWNDGVPGVTMFSIHPRDNYTHRFTVAGQYGSYFYHGHFGPAFADGQRGPVWVIPADWRPRPYSKISSKKEDIAGMKKAEENPDHVIVSDWNLEGMEILLMQYRDTGMPPWCSSSIVLNGKGRTKCHSKDLIDSFSGVGRNEMGCNISSPWYKYTNPVPCTETDHEIEVFEGKQGDWKMINFIHSGSHHELGISIDEHEFYVIAADGEFVTPQKVHRANINLGERISIMVHMNKEAKDYTVRMTSLRKEQLIEGWGILRYKTDKSGKKGTEIPDTESWVALDGKLKSDDHVYMDETRLAPFPPNKPPQYTNNTLRFVVEMTGDSTWVLNSAPHQGFRQQLPPIMWSNSSRADTSYGTADAGRLLNGSVVDIIFVNHGADLSMHPFHKHNQKAFIIGAGTGGFPFDSVAEAIDGGYAEFFNLVDPPLRDGCRLGFGHGAWTVIRYQILFPAVSMLHCHMIHHFAAGQQVILLEGIESMKEVPDYVKQRVHADFIPPVRFGPLD